MKTEDPLMLFTSDGHPDENLLFLAIEQELTPEEAAQVKEHLGSCWSCRVRSEEMQKGISAFMEYREKRYAPMLPAPPNHYRDFPGLLRAVSQESDVRESGWRLLKELWNRLLHFLFPGQLKWASLVAAAMAMILLYTQVIKPPSLSADELLTRAEATQDFGVGNKAAGSRIVRQTVQIIGNGQTTVKSFTWTTERSNHGAHWGDEQTWNVPLTAAGFAEWRQSLDEKTDKVRRSGSMWVLETIAPHDLIKEAWLTVRAADFHPIEQRLRFRDDRELTIKELSFDIEEQAPRARESTSKQEPQATTQTAATPKPRTVVVNLDETELQVRYELFKRQWDLGEELTITRTAGDVVLSGTVSSPERESNLHAVLAALPHVRLQISAPSSKLLPGPSSGSSALNPQSTAAPLLEEALEKAFSSREDQAAFVDKLLLASDTAISHAWALKALAERYDDSQIRKLQPDSREKISEMFQAHLRQLSQSNATLDRLVSLLPAGLEPVATPVRDWRQGVLRLFAQMQRQDHAVTGLLAGTPRKSQDLAASTADFESSHQTIQILLHSLETLNLESPVPER